VAVCGCVVRAEAGRGAGAGEGELATVRVDVRGVEDELETDAVVARRACVEDDACPAGVRLAPLRYGVGSTGRPFWRTSKCRCGPVQLPVQPT
jgi:hypothetical protein